MNIVTDTQWFKSSHSKSDGDCVEVAFLHHGMIGVRDSKNPTRPALLLTPTQWDSFTGTIACGQFGPTQS